MAKRLHKYFAFENLAQALDGLNIPQEVKFAFVGVLVDFLNDEYVWLGDVAMDHTQPDGLRLKAVELRYWMREVSRLLNDFKERYREDNKDGN